MAHDTSTTANDTLQSLVSTLTSTTTLDDNCITTAYPNTITSNNTWSWTYQNNPWVPISSSTYTLGNTPTQNNEKENNKMTNEFNFGPYDTSNVRLSPYGMAIKNKSGKWVSYDIETQSLIDVDIININIDSKKIFYKIPKSVSSVDIGDIVLHNNVPVFIEEVKGNKFVVVDPYECTELTILPPTSPYGFNYLPVIISLTDFFPVANNDNPFGNLLPIMLADNNSNLLPLLLASNQNFDIDPMFLLAMGSGNINPYLLMALGKKGQTTYPNKKAQDLAEKIVKYTKKRNSSEKAD